MFAQAQSQSIAINSHRSNRSITRRNTRRVTVITAAAQRETASTSILAPKFQREIATVAAKKTAPPPPPPPPPVATFVFSPTQAFIAGFATSAAIIKAHISAKSKSKLRKSKPILRYFDARGAAEVIRTCFAVAGVEYVDRRYTFSMDSGKSGKPQIEEQHGKDKEAGLFDANLLRLPILEVDGELLGQSPALARFIAEDLGMMGKGRVEYAKIDAYCENIKDMQTAYGKIRGNPLASASTPEIEDAKALWYNETMKSWLVKIENITGEGGYAVGKKISLADVMLYVILTQAFDNVDKVRECYSDLPKISAIIDNVGANEGVKSWLAKRPDNKF